MFTKIVRWHRAVIKQLTTGAAILTTFGIGAKNGSTVSVVELGDGVLHQTVLTMASTSLGIVQDGGDGDGVLVYTFPAGRILVLGATMDLSAVGHSTNIEANPNDTIRVAFGTVNAGDDDDLTDTEADIIPKVTVDTEGGGVEPPATGALVASAQFDGTSSAVKIYANTAITDAVASGTNIVTFTGTLTVSWINLGDY